MRIFAFLDFVGIRNNNNLSMELFLCFYVTFV